MKTAVAKILRVHTRTVTRYSEAGRLKASKLGVWRIKQSDLNAFLDRDSKTYTKAKAEALQKYITGQKNKKLFGGIVIQCNKAWQINSEKTYKWEKCEQDDWSDWDELKF
jgi:excisionase family DNA binding protein